MKVKVSSPSVWACVLRHISLERRALCQSHMTVLKYPLLGLYQHLKKTPHSHLVNEREWYNTPHMTQSPQMNFHFSEMSSKFLLFPFFVVLDPYAYRDFLWYWSGWPWHFRKTGGKKALCDHSELWRPLGFFRMSYDPFQRNNQMKGKVMGYSIICLSGVFIVQ